MCAIALHHDPLPFVMLSNAKHLGLGEVTPVGSSPPTYPWPDPSLALRMTEHMDACR